MPPQQTPPQYPVVNDQPVDHSQYEFIMNPGPAKRPSPLKGGKKPILIGAGLLVVVVIIIVGAVSLFSGGGQTNKPFLVVAQDQQEMARVAALQYTSLTQQTTKNFSINTQLTMTTDSASWLNYMHLSGIKISSKQLALGMHATTDTALANAVSTSSLNETVTKELQDELTTYKTNLRQAYAATTGKNARALLVQYDKNADLLLAQSKQ